MTNVVQLTHVEGLPPAEAAENLERCEKKQWSAKPQQSIVLPPYSITRIKLESGQHHSVRVTQP